VRRCETFAGKIDGQHARAFFGEQSRCGLSDAGCRSGDDGDAIRKAHDFLRSRSAK
jgi:hypothetical protein